MDKLKRLIESKQNLFINTKKEIWDRIFEILEWGKILINLEKIKTEREFLKKLYKELLKQENIKEIFTEYDINKNNFELFYLLDLEDELDIWWLKIIFNNIEKTSTEIQQIINYLVSYRERKIIFYMIWNLDEYYYLTWVEDMNIRERDDYLKIDL